MDKDSAVLQGAFLLANKLSLPSSLSSLQKADWSRVGHPVVETVRDICGQDKGSGHSNFWKKKIVCVVWLKLLCRQDEQELDKSWRENPFFSLQNSLPDVNHVVLLELVRSVAAANDFANLLLNLPQSQICIELERLTQHVKSSPTREEDVQLFLEVWWELWKGRKEQKAGQEGSTEAMFAKEFARLSSESISLSPQAAKKLKLETEVQLESSPNTDVLHILLYALKDIKDHVVSNDVCLGALSVSLDSFYTAFLIDQEVVIPVKEKMHLLSKAVSIREKNGEKLSPELIQEIQRYFSVSHSPSQFQSHKMELGEALTIITDLTQFWLNSGFLKVSDGANLTYSAFRLQQSVRRMLEEAGLSKTKTMTEMDVNEMHKLRSMLKSLPFPTIQTTPEADAKLTMTIISHRLKDYQAFAVLFASEKSWASCDEHWLDCLETNQAAFQEHDTLISLTSTIMSKINESSNVSQCRKLMKVTADIFSALSLEDKNKSLASMLHLSPRGFFSHAVPSAVTEGFEQELNMAFNCIIQGGAGASAAASQGNLNTAVSLVARVAFQNPHATLRSCCHSAIFNKGAFSFMAKILQQLTGLRGQRGGKDGGEYCKTESVKDNVEETKDDLSRCSLLCRCLHETVKNKLLLGSEIEQFLKFVGLLMTPVEGGGMSWCLLSPQEVVNVFVLPNLYSMGNSLFDSEVSVKLLHTALCMDVTEDQASSPHWVLNCSPFPLLYVLAQMYDLAFGFWEQTTEGAVHHWSMDNKELLELVLCTLGQVVGAEVAAAPDSWSRALFWLYNKMEELDWTVRFHLKPVWGEHFKNEVPATLMTVCDLPEQEWSVLDLPQYGQGTGLLAWMECCSISDSLRTTMLSHLSLDQRRLDHVSMFSKGLLVALTQTLPWCSVSQWSRLLGALRELITSGRLHVPFSLEYVDYLPLLDLRRFSCELRLSVLLLRVLQLLCGSSCSHWLSAEGWAHVGRLYAHAVRDVMNSVRAKLPLPSAGAGTISTSVTPKTNAVTTETEDSLREAESHMEVKVETIPCQEVLFVLSQLFCHVQHVQVMIPGGQCEPLFLSTLEILTHYKAIMAAFPDSTSVLESDNTRHFFSTITDNLENQEMKDVLQQKISQLVTSNRH